jgi:hypothetical protein
MKKLSLVVYGILLAFTIYPHFGFAQSGNGEVARSVPDLRMTMADDIWARTLSGSHYSELWNYQIYLDNGMSLYITFSATNFGKLKSPVTGIRVSVYGLDGNVYHLNREYPIDDLNQDRINYKFDLNPRQNNIWFKGKLPDFHEIYINTAKGGNRFKINLQFSDVVRGYKVGDGVFSYNGTDVGMVTHIPYARVTGYVGINENVKDVKGVASMDHSWQHENAVKLFSGGYRFIHHRDKNNWDIVTLMEPKDGKGAAIGYRLISESGRVRVERIAKSIHEKIHPDKKVKAPSLLVAHTHQGQLIRLSTSGTPDVSSVIADQGWLARQVIRGIVGGEIKDYRGAATMTLPNGTVKKGYFTYFAVE